MLNALIIIGIIIGVIWLLFSAAATALFIAAVIARVKEYRMAEIDNDNS